MDSDSEGPRVPPRCQIGIALPSFSLWHDSFRKRVGLGEYQDAAIIVVRELEVGTVVLSVYASVPLSCQRC